MTLPMTVPSRIGATSKRRGELIIFLKPVDAVQVDVVKGPIVKVIDDVFAVRKLHGNLHRKFFFFESQLSPIVKSNLVEITRIPV